MITKTKLPRRLHAAYDWVDAAGELDEIRRMAYTSADLEQYCKDAAANWLEHHVPGDDDDVEITAPDVMELWQWITKEDRDRREARDDY